MITKELMERLFPTGGLNPHKYNLVRGRRELIDALNRILPKYQINTHKRVCAFLGNCGVETDYFRTTIEYASGDAYEGRSGLGNTHRGDGRRFKGRGLTQTTGRYNYKKVQEAIGARLGIDVIKNPEKLAEIEIAVESACIFWKDNNLNSYADKGFFKQLSAIVNRGDKNLIPLHWAKRNSLYSLCKRHVPVDFAFYATLNDGGYIVANGDKPIPPDIGFGLASAEPQPATQALTLPKNRQTQILLAAAVDKNLSSEEARNLAKNHLPSFGARLWKFIARPVLWIYTALEAGNIAAWLGIVVVCGILIYVIYLNRAAIKSGAAAVKNKFLE